MAVVFTQIEPSSGNFDFETYIKHLYLFVKLFAMGWIVGLRGNRYITFIHNQIHSGILTSTMHIEDITLITVITQL